jgi:hypothetical protein
MAKNCENLRMRYHIGAMMVMWDLKYPLKTLKYH